MLHRSDLPLHDDNLCSCNRRGDDLCGGDPCGDDPCGDGDLRGDPHLENMGMDPGEHLQEGLGLLDIQLEPWDKDVDKVLELCKASPLGVHWWTWRGSLQLGMVDVEAVGKLLVQQDTCMQGCS